MLSQKLAKDRSLIFCKGFIARLQTSAPDHRPAYLPRLRDRVVLPQTRGTPWQSLSTF
jgi:hypothetical protein